MADSKKAAKSGGKQNSVNAAVPMSTPPPNKERVIKPEEYLPGVPQGEITDPNHVQMVRNKLQRYVDAIIEQIESTGQWQFEACDSFHWIFPWLLFRMVWRATNSSGRKLVQAWSYTWVLEEEVACEHQVVHEPTPGE